MHLNTLLYFRQLDGGIFGAMWDNFFSQCTWLGVTKNVFFNHYVINKSSGNVSYVQVFNWINFVIDHCIDVTLIDILTFVFLLGRVGVCTAASSGSSTSWVEQRWWLLLQCSTGLSVWDSVSETENWNQIYYAEIIINFSCLSIIYTWFYIFAILSSKYVLNFYWYSVEQYFFKGNKFLEVTFMNRSQIKIAFVWCFGSLFESSIN